MRLRGIEFGPVWGASGVQGFFGEGYWYGKLFRLLFPGLFTFRGVTFVAKTTTLLPRKGNMPLKEDGITPVEWSPRCIYVSMCGCFALNAVGLSGPGALALFEASKWQWRTKPFFLSFMSVEKTREERVREMREFVRMFKRFLPDFHAPVGLQVNEACPNVGLIRGAEEVADEACEKLSICEPLGIPLVVKTNALMSPEACLPIVRHRACDALSPSNTIPFDKYDRKRGFFPDGISPLEKRGFGPGGLSGSPILVPTLDWLLKADRLSFPKPINAGGGIVEAMSIFPLRLANRMVQSISIGSVAFLRPWRLRSIIKEAEWQFRNTLTQGDSHGPTISDTGRKGAIANA